MIAVKISVVVLCIMGCSIVCAQTIKPVNAKIYELHECIIFDSADVILKSIEETKRIICTSESVTGAPYLNSTVVVKHTIVICNKSQKFVYAENNEPFLLFYGIPGVFKTCDTEVRGLLMKVPLCYKPLCCDTVVKFTNEQDFGFFYTWCPHLQSVPNIRSK